DPCVELGVLRVPVADLEEAQVARVRLVEPEGFGERSGGGALSGADEAGDPVPAAAAVEPAPELLPRQAVKAAVRILELRELPVGDLEQCEPIPGPVRCGLGQEIDVELAPFPELVAVGKQQGFGRRATVEVRELLEQKAV